jgi:hypothetical protein
MKFRKLRIAWSVAWGLACILLIALWVRSERFCDLISKTDSSSRITTFCSSDGKLWFGRELTTRAHKPPTFKPKTNDWKYTLIEVAGNAEPRAFVFRFTSKTQKVQLPYAVPILFCIGAGMAPWIRRFSLRTLLIATTLVAVVLGLIVWMSQVG